MYVCICNAVTESQIVEAVKTGARTLEDLRQELGVSAQCGACADFARETLAHAKKALRAESSSGETETP